MMDRFAPDNRHRPEGARKPRRIEWIVTTPPIRVADLPGLAPRERIAELRQRVRSGTYNNRVVIERVARRILESGDL